MAANVVADDRALSVELGFDRTIDRSLVHRAAVAEVFVTDLRPLGDSRFLAGAQLPLTHGYYSDHVQRPVLFDPLLILEAGRQAGIGGAHLMGLPRHIIMLVDTFSLRIDCLPALAVGKKPGEMRIDCSFEAKRVRAGKVRRGVVRQELYVDGLHAGTHTMEVQVVTHNEHYALRKAMRGTPARSTEDFPDAPDDDQVAPHLVGRVHPLNVAIAGVVRGRKTVQARVTPRFGNRALFDHEYDHLPAMTLTEAARQLALLSVGDGTGSAAGRMHVTAVTGSFGRFAELDHPVFATAATSPGSAGGETVTVDVSFTQESALIAESTLTLVPSASIGTRQ